MHAVGAKISLINLVPHLDIYFQYVSSRYTFPEPKVYIFQFCFHLWCFRCILTVLFFHFFYLLFFQRKPINKLKLSIFPRLKIQLRRQSQFNARKKFQYAILCVRAMVRIKRLRYTTEPLRMEDSLKDPYRVKVLRKVSVAVIFIIHAKF